MAGAYPGSFDDRENDRQLKTILAKGIDTFVCLQLELEDDIPEQEWRSGNALRPYFIDARRLSKKPLIWRHLPIMDGDVPDDDVMEALVCDLLDDIKAGRVLYVHCLGGHGRAGIVVSLLLAVLYGMTVNEVFKRVQAYHDCRIEPQGVKSPSTVVQRSQVKRLLQQWANNKGDSNTEGALDPESSNKENKENTVAEPQVVVGKNGARGFIVSTEQTAPVPIVANNKSGEVPRNGNSTTAAPQQQQLALSASCGSVLSKQQPMRAQRNVLGQPAKVGLAMRNSNSALLQRPISMHRPTDALASRLSGKAAGTGAAAVQMLRKSSAKLAPFV